MKDTKCNSITVEIQANEEALASVDKLLSGYQQFIENRMFDDAVYVVEHGSTSR